MSTIPDPLDHELKASRAFKHLQDFQCRETDWFSGDHHLTWAESDVETRTVTFKTTAEQPSADPFGLIIGEFLHNLRSSLDLLAYSLTRAYTFGPLLEKVEKDSEFPIFGDVNSKGIGGAGPRMFKAAEHKTIIGWDPRAKAVVKRLQPYQRGNAFRDDPLWILHVLDNVNKHRLLHTTFASFEGTMLDRRKGRTFNMAVKPDGFFESLGGAIDTDTPIARISEMTRIDPDAEVRVEIQPAFHIAFAQGTPIVQNEKVYSALLDIYVHVVGEVFHKLTPFL